MQGLVWSCSIVTSQTACDRPFNLTCWESRFEALEIRSTASVSTATCTSAQALSSSLGCSISQFAAGSIPQLWVRTRARLARCSGKPCSGESQRQQAITTVHFSPEQGPRADQDPTLPYPPGLAKPSAQVLSSSFALRCRKYFCG